MKIEGSDYAVAPLVDPLIYPGKIPDHSFIYIGDYFFPLNVKKDCRIGKSRIKWLKDLPKDIEIRGDLNALDNCLLRFNTTSMDWRYPVLAYGSNASPSQLKRKFSDDRAGSIVPVIKTKIQGLDVVYSAHMSSYGAIPSTLIASPTTEITLFITFLDKMQLHIIDNTERNYDRVRISGHEFPIILESGEKLSECYAYLSKSGVLLLDNHPVRLADIPSKLANFKPASEGEVLSRVVDLANHYKTTSPIKDTKDLLAKIKNTQISTSDITNLLRTNFSKLDVGIPQKSISQLNIYRDIPSSWLNENDIESFTVLPNYKRKPGDYAIAVHSNVKSRLNLGRYGVVEYKLDGNVFSVIASLSSSEIVKNESYIHMDQTIRSAIGAKVRERVNLYPIPDHGGLPQRLIDKLIPRKYQVMRVQLAAKIMIEKAGCLMPKIAMEIMSIEPGDEVVLESAVRDNTESDYRIEKLTLRAYPTPSNVQELREKIQSGMLHSRFPDCSESFSTFPDLPWLFIDADARNTLGLDKCSPIRLYASRKYQLMKEFREFAFLIIVTLLSAISLVDIGDTISIAGFSLSINLVLIIPAILITALIVYLSLRRRMS